MTLTPEDSPVASELTRPVAAGGTNSRCQATVGGIPEVNPVIGDVKDDSIHGRGGYEHGGIRQGGCFGGGRASRVVIAKGGGLHNCNVSECVAFSG